MHSETSILGIGKSPIEVESHLPEGYFWLGEEAALLHASDTVARICPDIVVVSLPAGTLSLPGFLSWKAKFSTIIIAHDTKAAPHAIQAGVSAYLVHPFDAAQFHTALTRARRRIEERKAYLSQKKAVGHPADLVELQLVGGRLVEIRTSQVSHAKAFGDLTQLFSIDDGLKWVLPFGIGKCEEVLIPHGFFRVHKSYLVNRAAVPELFKLNEGNLTLQNGVEVPLAKRRKREFLEWLKGSGG